MKKIIITVLMMMALLGLVACNGEDSDNANFGSEKSISSFSNIEIGDVIRLGHYNQDNSTENGVDEIEWQVLTIKDNKALVVSKLALDCQAYHNSYSDVSWEESSLRRWLNNTFYTTAFSDKEQRYIAPVNLSDEDRDHSNMNTSDPIVDNIFLLSVTEAEAYFSSGSDRMCLPSSYTAEQNDGEITKPCIWWLRTRSNVGTRTAYVDESGNISKDGVDLNASFGHTYKGEFCHNDAAVRPAMWVYISNG